jgi:hypothetical protein
MTSFARARNEDEGKRGIKTLWELYSGHMGYCLQFDESDVRDLARLDASKGSYEWIGVDTIKYGVDENSGDFRELGFQLGEQYLMMIARSTKDARIKLNIEAQWPPTVLYQKLFNFCGTHKDPCYSDEREVRILAYPSQQPAHVFYLGIAGPKTIRKGPTGKRYIAIGEHWRPGISPRRIIVGTKADPNIDAIVAKFGPVPEIAYANLPIA